VRFLTVHDPTQIFKPAIMIEATFAVREYRANRRCPIAQVGRAAGLEIVYADFGGSVEVPAWISPKRFSMAVVAPCFAAEEHVAAIRCRLIEAFLRGLRSHNRELIDLQRRKPDRHPDQYTGRSASRASPKPLAAAIGNCDALFRRGSQNRPLHAFRNLRMLIPSMSLSTNTSPRVGLEPNHLRRADR